MKRNVVLGIIGGTVLVAGAVVAYIKRDAIREAKNDIIADVKRLLKKEKHTLLSMRLLLAQCKCGLILHVLISMKKTTK